MPILTGTKVSPLLHSDVSASDRVKSAMDCHNEFPLTITIVGGVRAIIVSRLFYLLELS